MMCEKKSFRGWDHISPPLTPEELLARKKKRDEEKHEYMGMLKDVVR